MRHPVRGLGRGHRHGRRFDRQGLGAARRQHRPRRPEGGREAQHQQRQGRPGQAPPVRRYRLGWRRQCLGSTRQHARAQGRQRRGARLGQGLHLPVQPLAQRTQHRVADAALAQLLQGALQREAVGGLADAQHAGRMREVQPAHHAQQQGRPRAGADRAELGHFTLPPRQLRLGHQARPEARRPAREGDGRGIGPERPHGAPQGGLGDVVIAALDLGEHERPALDAAQEGGQGRGRRDVGRGGRGSGSHTAILASPVREHRG